jgi:hypothetical protein
VAKTGDFGGHQRGLQLAKTGDFLMATDTGYRPIFRDRLAQCVGSLWSLAILVDGVAQHRGVIDILMNAAVVGFMVLVVVGYVHGRVRPGHGSEDDDQDVQAGGGTLRRSSGVRRGGRR